MSAELYTQRGQKNKLLPVIHVGRSRGTRKIPLLESRNEHVVGLIFLLLTPVGCPIVPNKDPTAQEMSLSQSLLLGIELETGSPRCRVNIQTICLKVTREASFPQGCFVWR